MQAIMLAAGQGKRLGKYTDNNTKCMLEVNGEKLLDRTIKALKNAGVAKLILVIGYEGEKVRNHIAHNVTGMDITFVENILYEETNNIHSLFLAKDFLAAEDTILLESDLIFEEQIIYNVVKSPLKNVAVVAPYEQWMDGTVTRVNKQNDIIEFIEKKDFSFDRVHEYYKTVNIYKFSKEFSKQYYIPFLKAYIEAYGKNKYYELVLKTIVNVSKSGLKALNIGNDKWYEIDDIQDLDIARNLFPNTKEERLKSYQKRFGGYWRFNQLKDFCYLVNPYFPPPKMSEKIQSSFNMLLTQYPSGMYVQSINAGRMFNVDESKIIVGNGAAELINSLKSIIYGKIALPIPTFNEYIRCFNNCNFKFIDTSEDNYTFNKEKILSNIQDVDSVIIINPDNPSGAFITYSDIIEIIEFCNRNDKKIIIDESFIDFANEDERYTLIDDNILDMYKNLIIIKSISKSYGVPGIRLGILATSNQAILEQVKNDMPVWNINSLGEYFLQIINLYKDDYNGACKKIAEERNWFYEQLKKISYLKPYQSQANYILCKVGEGILSTELAETLIEKYNILIKDLNDKKGFENRQYIRLAVRGRQDNSQLLRALTELGNKSSKGTIKNG